MARSPVYIGQTRLRWVEAWSDDSSVAVSLVGATIVLRISLNPNGAGYNGTGTLTVTNAAGGLFTYQPSAPDFPTPGFYSCQYKATFSDLTVLDGDTFQVEVRAAV